MEQQEQSFFHQLYGLRVIFIWTSVSPLLLPPTAGLFCKYQQWTRKDLLAWDD